jgi:hypothetical protein
MAVMARESHQSTSWKPAGGLDAILSSAGLGGVWKAASFEADADQQKRFGVLIDKLIAVCRFFSGDPAFFNMSRLLTSCAAHYPLKRIFRFPFELFAPHRSLREAHFTNIHDIFRSEGDNLIEDLFCAAPVPVLSSYWAYGRGLGGVVTFRFSLTRHEGCFLGELL